MANFIEKWFDKNLAAQSNDQWLRRLVFGDSQSLMKKNSKKNKKTSGGSNAGGASSGGGTRGGSSSSASKPDMSSLASQLAGALGGSGSSGGGGGVANKIDMTPYINSLKEGAAANKKTISDSYAAQRNQLAQQLKQYQENTATARQQAMDAYNSARADLEEQSYMNMRAAQQSAASRGLGGSGLQQLAQLSSQIESSNQTNDLAEQNTNTQNDLTKQLKDMEQQITTATNDLTTEEGNKIAEIDANTAQAIAQAQYQEDVRYQEALQEAAARNAALASQRSSTLEGVLSALNDYDSQLDSTMREGVNQLSNAFKNSDYFKNQKYTKKAANELTSSLSSILSKYDTALNQVYGNSGMGKTGASYYDYYRQQLQNAYNTLTNNLYVK